tara:strand:+ start:4814 stop:5449 length:636 start_codon:yes stop_codon:yes gene_type:complete
MKKFFINLDDDTSRADKFNDTDYIRWRATSREEVSDDLYKKMISYYNYPEKAHLGRCGCFQSHISLLEHIVKNKLNDVLIVEDDAVQVSELPTDYPKDSLIYVGGFLHNKRMTDNKKVIIKSTDGLNNLPDDYRILMTLSYIIPTWEVADDILKKIKLLKRYRAIDILLGNLDIKKSYIYPACFIEEGGESTIQKKAKRSNELYEWVKSSS